MDLYFKLRAADSSCAREIVLPYTADSLRQKMRKDLNNLNIKYLQFCDVRQSSSENLVNISNTLGRFVIAADFKSEIGA